MAHKAHSLKRQIAYQRCRVVHLDNGALDRAVQRRKLSEEAAAHQKQMAKDILASLEALSAEKGQAE